jgi:formate-dependent nitrite reductase membrane component NrfD
MAFVVVHLPHTPIMACKLVFKYELDGDFIFNPGLMLAKGTYLLSAIFLGFIITQLPFITGIFYYKECFSP